MKKVEKQFNTTPKSVIEIIPLYCKGCSICEEFCPGKVLKVVDFKIAVVNGDACIACNQCEMRCPDFAINVTKTGGSKKEESSGG